MLLRFDTALSAIWLTTSLEEARGMSPDRSAGQVHWTPLTRSQALTTLQMLPDREEALQNIRSALANSSVSRVAALGDSELLDLAADQLSHGWVARIDRHIPSGGWTSGGAPTAPVIRESVEPPVYATGVPEKKEKDHWIIIELVGENGEPIPGELCRITLPDNDVVERETNSQGRVEEYSIIESTCQIEFPELDMDAWEAVTNGG